MTSRPSRVRTAVRAVRESPFFFMSDETHKTNKLGTEIAGVSSLFLLDLDHLFKCVLHIAASPLSQVAVLFSSPLKAIHGPGVAAGVMDGSLSLID